MNTTTFKFLRSALIIGVLVAAGMPAQAQPCPEPPGQQCSILTQFPSGRWDLSGFGGQYRVNGQEVYEANLGPDTHDFYQVNGLLSVEHPGGEDENFIDVSCDGTVNGRGWERISGTITKNPIALACSTITAGNGEMSWDVVIERRYAISGHVSGPSEVEMTRQIEEATITVDGHFAQQLDCVFFESDHVINLDISGDLAVEDVIMTIDYDAFKAEYESQVTPLQPRTWMDDVSHRIVLDVGFAGPSPRLLSPIDEIPPQAAEYIYMFLQEVTEVEDILHPDLLGRTPLILDLVIEEPKYYLEGVPATTRVTAQVDWRRSEAPQSVTFSYDPAAPVTITPDPEAVYEFDASAPFETIEAVAVAGGRASAPFIVITPKVTVPEWAGAAIDWSAQPGIDYSANVDWPITLQTTRTINTLSLFSGLWGITGAAESDFQANASSSGKPQDGNLNTQVTLKLAGREAKEKLQLSGTNQTTLSCDSLSTEGQMEASIPIVKWEETLNPLSLIPGVGKLCIDDKGILCGVIEGFGLKLTAKVDTTGFVDFASNPATDKLRFTAGSVLGEISAGAELNVVPRPLEDVASLSVAASGGGCLLIDAAPQFDIAGLGGKLYAKAEAHLIFLGTVNAEKEWLFGDACHTGKPIGSQSGGYAKGTAGWVPDDGQLAMALGPADAAAAVWTQPHPGQIRPSGDIVLRLYRQGQWESPIALTDDLESDIAPAAAFDRDGKLVVVYLRNEVLPLPTDLSAIDAFAAGFELYAIEYDPASGQAGAPLRLTNNADTDFGVFLKTDRQGDLHLFWQRAAGADFVGSSAEPASLHAMSRVGGQWGAEETVAGDLESVFGWSPAAAGVDDMLVGLVLDTDHNLSTPEDREIHAVVKQGGLWGALENRSNNARLDDSPIAGFGLSGEAVLLWRSAGQVWQATGTGSPQMVLEHSDPPFVDGIDLGFGRAELALGHADLLVWADATQLLLSRRSDPAADGGWEAAEALLPGLEDAQQVHAVELAGNRLRVAYSTRRFSPDGLTLEPGTTPAIAELNQPGCLAGPACDVIFRGDFE